MADDRILTSSELQELMGKLPDWDVHEGWLRKTYQTPGWPHTLMAVNTIGYLAEAAYHHPDLIVGYAQLTVKLQTHRVKGLTRLDVELAERIDQVLLWKPAAGSPFDGFPKNWVHVKKSSS